MESVEKIVAKQLLDVKAVKLNVENPFTWASGWKSPIYCDNRKILSYPAARKVVYEAFAEIICKYFKDVDVIAGVATGAIAYGMMVAEVLGKPFVYVRPKPKDHGTGSQIEGDLPKNARVVVVEDLISTGGSCIEVVEALRNAGADVLGIVSIFTYGMQKGIDRIAAANTKNYSLSNLDALVEVAAEEGYIKAEDKERILKFRNNPSDESWIK
jgi:orotate phosphoribosyltransferase